MRRDDNERDAAAAFLVGAGIVGVTRSGREDCVARADDLNALDSDLLRRRWRAAMGRPAPASLSRALMIRILSWREQVARLGDLDAKTLAALSAALQSDHKCAALSSIAPSLRAPRPGSILVREHRGQLQRVMVLDQGYAWNGQTYASLSSVALAITGTNWNGRRFFGLDRNPKAEKFVPEGPEAAGRAGSTA